MSGQGRPQPRDRCLTDSVGVRYIGLRFALREPVDSFLALVGPRLPHRIACELISALGRGTNLDVAAIDQSRPSVTRAATPIHPMRSMRCIFIPHLGKLGLAYFSPSECEVAHTMRGIFNAARAERHGFTGAFGRFITVH
jgi:hypothetical protein